VSTYSFPGLPSLHGLHLRGPQRLTRVSRFQRAPHDLPPNRIVEQRVDLIRHSTPPTFLARPRRSGLGSTRLLHFRVVTLVSGSCERGRGIGNVGSGSTGWCCYSTARRWSRVLAAPLVRLALEQRQRQSTSEEPCMRRTRQARCMWQQCASELFLEIRVRRGPAARTDSRANAVVNYVRELRFQGTEQSAPRSGRDGWAVNDGI